MKRIIGFLLIALGVVMLVWTGFTYTKREKVVDAGPLQISADRKKSVNWPPYTGAALLLGGVVLLASSRKNE